MNKQELFEYLDKELESAGYCYESFGGGEPITVTTSQLRYIVVCGLLLHEIGGLTAYCEELEIKWSKAVVDTLEVIHLRNELDRKDCFQYNSDEGTELFAISFNLLRGNGWEFDWGTNIYSAWIDWVQTTARFAWHYDNSTERIAIDQDILSWLFEWTNL